MARTGRKAGAAVGALVIVLAGLVGVRWVALSSAAPATRAEAAQPAAAQVVVLATATEEVDPRAARDEAMRLAGVALSLDNLPAARDLYILALEVTPGDREATVRLGQVRVALGVGERQRPDPPQAGPPPVPTPSGRPASRDAGRGWEEALADLRELRDLAPDSAVLLDVYVTALVRAGREALARGDEERAQDRCEEAARWLPSLPEAQLCVVEVRAGPRPLPEEEGATPIPSATPRPTAVPVTPARLNAPPTDVGNALTPTLSQRERGRPDASGPDQ